MKKKFLILRSNRCNGYWSYLGKPKEDRETYITDVLGDRFLLTGVEDAVQFDSKEEAEELIQKLSQLGIFKIEEIYINDFPQSLI